jgi:type II secretory pathway component PulK
MAAKGAAMIAYLLPALVIAVILAATAAYWRSTGIRCQQCRRRIRGSYASDGDAPVERPRYRCWPECPGP